MDGGRLLFQVSYSFCFRKANEKEPSPSAQATSAGSDAMNSEIVLIDEEDAPGPSNCNIAQKSGTFSRQTTMTAFAKQPTTKARSQKITRLITNVIVGDLRPINLVEGKHFKALVSYLEPSYVLPSRKTFTKQIDGRYDESKTTLVTDLKKVTHMALTCHMWTSSNSCKSESYLGVTAHYLKPSETQLNTTLLAVKEVGAVHTSANIARWLSSIIEDYELCPEQIVACVTDNGANMVAAMENLKTEYGWAHFRCAAHTLQLSVHDCLKENSTSRAIGKCNF